jgi:hypothetical protein
MLSFPYPIRELQLVGLWSARLPNALSHFCPPSCCKFMALKRFTLEILFLPEAMFLNIIWCSLKHFEQSGQVLG